MQVGPGTAVVPSGLDGQSGGKRWCSHCKNGQLFREGDDAVCLQCGYREDADATGPDSFAVLVVAVQKAAEALAADLQRANERKDVLADQVVRVGRALTALTAPKSETGSRRGNKWSPEAKARQAERTRARRDAAAA